MELICLQLRHGLGRLCRGCSFSRRGGLLWGVLRSALSLQLFGVEDSVAVEAAVSQSLGVVFESVRRSFGSGVVDSERLILFHQHELHVRALALDGAGLDVSSDSQPLCIGAVAHLVQLFDGDVIALGVLYAGVGEVAEQKENGRRRCAEFDGNDRTRHRDSRGSAPTFKLYAQGKPEARWRRFRALGSTNSFLRVFCGFSLRT